MLLVNALQTTDYGPQVLSNALRITPTKLIYGGEALGHHAGRTVLVPRVLPGERAEVEEVRTAKGVVHARPLRILQAAPERIEPPCPYFGRCGGCQYQHLSPELQSTTKREILRRDVAQAGEDRLEGRNSVARRGLRGTIGTRPNSRSPGKPMAGSSWAFSSPSRTESFPWTPASSFRRA